MTDMAAGGSSPKHPDVLSLPEPEAVKEFRERGLAAHAR